VRTIKKEGLRASSSARLSVILSDSEAIWPSSSSSSRELSLSSREATSSIGSVIRSR